MPKSYSCDDYKAFAFIYASDYPKLMIVKAAENDIKYGGLTAVRFVRSFRLKSALQTVFFLWSIDPT